MDSAAQFYGEVLSGASAIGLYRWGFKNGVLIDVWYRVTVRATSSIFHEGNTNGLTLLRPWLEISYLASKFHRGTDRAHLTSFSTSPIPIFYALSEVSFYG